LTNYGWALHDTEAEGADRCLRRGRFQTPAKWTFVDRYMYMRESVRRLVRELQPDRIGLEFPIFDDLWSEGMYGLFLFTCEALRIEKADVVFFTPGQTKAHAAHLLERPKGWKMSKMDMVEAAKADTGGKGRWNHNEADAYWAARTAGRFWTFYEDRLTKDDLTPKERHQFARIHTYVRGAKAGKTVKTGIVYREQDRFFLWSVAEPPPQPES